MKRLSTFLIAACLCGASLNTQAATANNAAAPKKAGKKALAHKNAKPAEPKPGPLLDEDGKLFNAGTAAVTELDCELGNKLALYRNATDDEHMGLRWKQRVHQMTRVSTTTGANRFENSKFGLVWIGIPAKGMLLDSKRGQQLANECKDADQIVVKPALPGLPTKSAELPGPIPAPRADGKPSS